MTAVDRVDLLLDRLVTHGPGIIEQVYPHNACIAAARCARTALAQLGVPSTPLPVMVDARSQNRWVHIGPDATGPGWSGHLVLDVQGRLLDLTVGQVNRPGLEAHAHWTRMNDGLPVVVEQPGAVVVYRPLADDGWRQSPNWASPDPWQVEARRAVIEALLVVVAG